MSDHTQVSPVLTPEEWSGLNRGRPVHCIGVDGDQFIGVAHEPDSEGEGVMIDGGSYTASIFEAENVRRLIAIANAALPNDDPRKITRETVELIRDAGWGAREAGSYGDEADEVARAALHRVAAALESYLPPV